MKARLLFDRRVAVTEMETAFADLVLWAVPRPVRGDVHALLDVGVLQRGEDWRIEFPFDAVHVDFTLRAA